MSNHTRSTANVAFARSNMNLHGFTETLIFTSENGAKIATTLKAKQAAESRYRSAKVGEAYYTVREVVGLKVGMVHATCLHRCLHVSNLRKLPAAKRR